MKTFFAVSMFVLALGSLFLWASISNAGSVEKYGQTIVETCTQEEVSSECYEREIPKLYPQLSVDKVFDVVRYIRRNDMSYQFCHVAAHFVGERVVADDPNSWTSSMRLNPSDGLCSNGFIHGVIGGRFRADVLTDETLEHHIQDFSRACAASDGWNPSELDQAICHHGMGHLYMFITDADVEKSLSLCERTTDEQYQRVCIEGVFMQIYQPLEPDDYVLIERLDPKPTKDTVREYCARYEEDEHEGACLRESWPFVQEGIWDGTGISEFCSGHPNDEETQKCYVTGITIASRFSLQNDSAATDVCSYIPDEHTGLCFTTFARSLIEEDRSTGTEAVARCMSAPTQYQDVCISNLIATAHFMFGDSSHGTSFCEAVPPTYTNSCMAQLNR